MIPLEFPEQWRVNQNGNALFLILIAVAMFAALSYAITQSGRGAGNTDRENAMLAAGVAEQCNGYVERAVSMLTLMGGCTLAQVSYELPDGTNDNPLAPVDKSCHVFDKLGAGYSPCGLYLSAFACDLEALAVGEKCDDADIIYAGISGGNRIYATLVDQGTASWNNGSTNWTNTGNTSLSDGLANTNGLVALSDAGAPYAAALMCRALGADWYLPSQDELALLYSVKNTGAFNGTFTVIGVGVTYYWTSSDSINAQNAWRQRFSTGAQAWLNKDFVARIRCVRQ